LPIIIPARDATSLPARLRDALSSVLNAIDISPAVIEHELAEMAEVCFAKTANRTILGSMNDLALNAAFDLDDGREFYDVVSRVARDAVRPARSGQSIRGDGRTVRDGTAVTRKGEGRSTAEHAAFLPSELRTMLPSQRCRAQGGAEPVSSRGRPSCHATPVCISPTEVARAMVIVTGGGQGAAGQSELSQLVARFAVAEPADARRTGAQAIAAMADALPRLPRPPAHAMHTAHKLRKRAEELAKAEPLDYAAQLKDALSLVVGALDRAAVSPAERSLLDEARVAVDAIRPDRPLQLQEAAVQEALRLVSDAITVAISAR
jgi:hypothetical protein